MKVSFQEILVTNLFIYLLVNGIEDYMGNKTLMLMTASLSLKMSEAKIFLEYLNTKHVYIKFS